MAARLEGLDKALAQLHETMAKIESITAEEVRETGIAILAQAVEDAPVDKGDLRRSGSLQWGEDVELIASFGTSKSGKHVDTYEVSGNPGGLIAKGTNTGMEGGVQKGGVEVVDGGQIPEGTKPVVTIGFSVPYAAAQHEGDSFDHPSGGRSKYLQTAIQDKADMLLEAIKKRREEAIK